MLISRPASPRRKSVPLAAWMLAATLAAAAAQPARADRAAPAPAPAASALPADTAPADADDAVARLLKDRGLVDAAAAAAAAEPTPPPKGLRQRMSDAASDLVITSMNFLGVPYRRGGQSDAGFDCSGFTRYIFEHTVGLVLPRRAEEQARAPGLKSIDRDELKPGDLVFFNTLRRTFSHVGIYVGDHKFIHSPRAGGEVRMEDMRLAYWTKRYNGARRALDTPADSHPAATPAPAAAAAPRTGALTAADPTGF